MALRSFRFYVSIATARSNPTELTFSRTSRSPESEISVWARPLNSPINDSRLNSVVYDSNRSFEVDAKGNFVIEDLAPGDYEVEVSVNVEGPGARRRLTAKQSVSVTTGTPAQASLVLDLTAKGSDK